MPQTRRWPDPESVVEQARKGIVDDTLVHASLAELASLEHSDTLTAGDPNADGQAAPSGDEAPPRRNGSRRASVPATKARVVTSRRPH